MNEKGGVGKTTITAHAGWYFARNHKTLLIDLDQQANLSMTMAAHHSTVASVQLFAETTRIPPAFGPLTIAPAGRELGGVESADPAVIETFRNSIQAMSADYEICVIDTPPALAARTFGAILAADAILAPLDLGEYALAGVTELIRAIKGVSAHYQREEPKFLGLLPSNYDRKSPEERLRFQSLIEEVGDLVFPGVIPKRDVYRSINKTGEPVWAVKTKAGRQAADEIRAVFDKVAELMEIS